VPFGSYPLRDTTGLSWQHVKKRWVWLVIDQDVMELSLNEWGALCSEAPGEIGHLALDYPRRGRVPFYWHEWVDLFSVPPGEIAESHWSLAGPEDAILKRIGGSGRVDWDAELAEYEAWVLANDAAKAVLPGYLYLIQREDGRGPVKFGFSREPEKRAGRIPAAYRKSGRFAVRAKVRGSAAEERLVHRVLAPYRLLRAGSREWYRPVTPVLTALEVIVPRVRKEMAPATRRNVSYSRAAFLRGFTPGGLPSRSMRVFPLSTPSARPSVRPTPGGGSPRV
jgi:T5orf172 domain